MQAYFLLNNSLISKVFYYAELENTGVSQVVTAGTCYKNN